MKYRDPITGEIKDIYVKPAGDTLPIGTIVDYNGSTVPDGYEVVEDDIQTLTATSTSTGSGNINTGIKGTNKSILSAYLTTTPAESTSYSRYNIALIPYFVPDNNTWLLAVVDTVSLKKVSNVEFTYKIFYINKEV